MTMVRLLDSETVNSASSVVYPAPENADAAWNVATSGETSHSKCNCSDPDHEEYEGKDDENGQDLIGRYHEMASYRAL